MGLGLWLGWCLLSALGWGLGWLVSFLVGWGIFSMLEPVLGKTLSDPIGWGLTGALLGLWLGASQGWLLRRYGHPTRPWMLASAMGGLLGNLTGWLVAPKVLVYGVGPETAGAWVITGLVVGILQSLLARNQIPHPLVWGVLSSLCWAAAMAGWPLGGLLAGAAHGLGFIWMQRKAPTVRRPAQTP
jgi:hypothetical protein